MAGLHARIAPSSLKRTINCLGSLLLVEQLVAKGLRLRNTVAAQKGTCAHAAAELCLREGHDAIEMVGRTFEGIEVDEEMAANVQVYLDLCRRESAGVPAEHVFVEERINLDALRPPERVWGTSDFFVLKKSERTLTVIDYKNGYILVEANDNDQGRCYALGAWLLLQDPTVEWIEVVICQPNAQHKDGVIRRERIHWTELRVWYLKRLRPALEQMTQPGAPLKPGEWCNFCPAYGACPEAQRDRIERAQLIMAQMPGRLVEEPPKPETLPLAQLELIWEAAPMLRSWLSAVDTELFHRLNSGLAGEKTKLAARMGRRKWKGNPHTVATALTSLFALEEGQLYTERLKSPAQIEKLLPKQQRPGLKAYWEKPMMGASIVAIDDERAAVSNVAQVIFAERDED